MKLQVTSDNIDISASMQELAEKKIEKLHRHWSDLPEESVAIRVVLNKAPEETFSAKVEADINGHVVVAEATHFEFETALVSAIDELERRYAKIKDKKHEDWEEQRKRKTLTEVDLARELDEEAGLFNEDVTEDDSDNLSGDDF